MITDTGLLIMLRSLIAKPMLLCVFNGDVEGDDPPLKAFSMVGEPQKVDASWQVEPKSRTATGKEVTFTFDGDEGDVAGWVLYTRDEKAVVAFDYFKKPYPINSERDTVAVTPVLLARQRD